MADIEKFKQQWTDSVRYGAEAGEQNPYFHVSSRTRTLTRFSLLAGFDVVSYTHYLRCCPYRRKSNTHRWNCLQIELHVSHGYL
jgi:hypothetical protein